MTIEHLDLTRLRAVTFDLRGHREPDPATDGYTLERIAADALAVADAAGDREFVVEGDPVRMAQVAEPYMTRQAEPELPARFGRDAATVGRAALEGT